MFIDTKNLFLVVCLTLLSGCFHSKSEDVLTIGTNVFPPYEMINDAGAWEGFDIDLAHIIGKKLGKKVVFKDINFDGLILSLKQNKIDLILAGMSITPSRKHEIEMVHYHGKSYKEYSLLFWDTIPQGITKIEDLQNISSATVCIQAGHDLEDFLEKHSFINIKNLDEISDLIMEIKYGKSTACALESSTAHTIMNKYPNIKELKVPLAEDERPLGHGIGIKKDNSELIDKILTIVTELKKDGTLKKLTTKWFKN